MTLGEAADGTARTAGGSGDRAVRIPTAADGEDAAVRMLSNAAITYRMLSNGSCWTGCCRTDPVGQDAVERILLDRMLSNAATTRSRRLPGPLPG